MAKKHRSRALGDPTQLEPIADKQGTLQVIIETPKGSRNKFAFDPEQEIFTLKKVLPAGMVFPYDFGFLPKTLADDGDPIDVLLLMDEPAFPGNLVRARLIGVIEGEQLDGKKTVRNDRLVAVAEANHMYAHTGSVGLRISLNSTQHPFNNLRSAHPLSLNWNSLIRLHFHWQFTHKAEVSPRLDN